MDPTLWNQNGIDSGTESPESELVNFRLLETESILHGQWPRSAGVKIGISSSLLEQNRNRFQSTGIKHKSVYN